MSALPRLYLVSYDISSPRRWRQAFKALSAAGAWSQLSVFLCRLQPSAMIRLEQRLAAIIDPGADRLMVIDLGEFTPALARIRLSGKGELPAAPKTLIF